VQTIDFDEEMEGFDVESDSDTFDSDDDSSESETQSFDVGDEFAEFGLDDDSDDGELEVAETTAAAADFLFRGWSKTTGWVGISPPTFANEPAESVIPYRRYGMQENLLLSSRYSRRQRFEVVTSALIRYNVQLPEPTVGDATTSGRDATSHEFEASLRDAYLGVFRDDVDFRIGLQRIPWGNSDGFAVNDVVNARDRRDPTLTESEAVNIPTFAARLDYDMGSNSVFEVVVSPFFTSDRVDVYGTRWALVQQDAPLSYRRMLGSAWDDLPPAMRQQVQPLLQTTEQPVDDFSSASAGAAFKKGGSDGDVSFYYQYGYDTNPNLQVDPQFALLIENLEPDEVTGAMLYAVMRQV
jgi:hypothetical protein